MISVPVWKYKEKRYIIKDVVNKSIANLVGPDSNECRGLILSCIDKENDLSGRDIQVGYDLFYSFATKIGTAAVKLEL